MWDILRVIESRTPPSRQEKKKTIVRAYGLVCCSLLVVGPFIVGRVPGIALWFVWSDFSIVSMCAICSELLEKFNILKSSFSANYHRDLCKYLLETAE